MAKHKLNETVDEKGIRWIELTCITCGVTFAIKLPKYCSTKCYGERISKKYKSNTKKD